MKQFSFLFISFFSFLFSSEIGVNYYDGFVRVLKYNDFSYKKDFKKLHDNNINVVRINGSGFFYSNDWKFYIKNKKKYFSLLDDFIKEAEKNNIKLIFDFFWRYSAIPNLNNETIKKAYGDVNSKSFVFMKQYIKEVIQRYKNSAAILMWEIGNEYNLKINLPYKRVKKFFKHCKRENIFTFEIYDYLMKNLVSYIKSLDSSRKISSGNSIPRGYIYYKKLEINNIPDKLTNIILKENKYFDTISVHLYPWTLKKRKFMKFFKDFDSFLYFLKQIGIKNNKLIVIGEFGVCRIKNKLYKIKLLCDYVFAFKKYDIDYALIWVYNRKKHKKCNISEKELSILRTFNELKGK